MGIFLNEIRGDRGVTRKGRAARPVLRGGLNRSLELDTQGARKEARKPHR